MPFSEAVVVRLALAGVALAVVTSCSSGGGSAQPPTTITHVSSSSSASSRSTTGGGATPSTTGGVPSTTAPAGVAQLGDLVLSSAPSGFVLQPDDQAQTGPTNLAKAATDDVWVQDTNAARQILRGAGFLHGYQRQWQSTDGVDQNFIFLYQFATPEGAASYVQHWQETIGAHSPFPLTPFSPAYVPGGIGLAGSDNNGSSAQVLFSKGPYAVQAVVTGQPLTDQSGAAGALALAQYARLP